MRQRFFNLTTGTLSDLLDQQISQHETCVRTHVMFAVVPRQRQRVLLEGELLRHVLHVLVHHEAFLLDILSHILSHILAKILRMNKRNLLLLFRRLVVDNKYTPQRQRVLLEGELLRHVLHVLVHHEAFLLDILSHILSHILAKILRMNKRNLLLLFRRLVVDNKYTPQTTPMFSWPFLLHLLRHLRSVVDLPKTCQRKKRRR